MVCTGKVIFFEVYFEYRGVRLKIKLKASRASQFEVNARNELAKVESNKENLPKVVHTHLIPFANSSSLKI